MSPRALSASERAVEPGSAPVRLSRLWVGVLVAPFAWAVAELVGYFFAARSCDGKGGVPLLGTLSPHATQIVLALILAAVAAWGLFIAAGNWRAVRHLTHTTGDLPARGRSHFMAFGGLLSSSIFLLGILLFLVSGFLVIPCSQMRGVLP